MPNRNNLQPHDDNCADRVTTVAVVVERWLIAACIIMFWIVIFKGVLGL